MSEFHGVLYILFHFIRKSAASSLETDSLSILGTLKLTDSFKSDGSLAAHDSLCILGSFKEFGSFHFFGALGICDSLFIFDSFFVNDSFAKNGSLCPDGSKYVSCFFLFPFTYLSVIFLFIVFNFISIIELPLFN